jgi:cAMP-dependent protein kinase regulator
MDLASPPLENKPKQDSNDKKFQSQKSMGGDKKRKDIADQSQQSEEEDDEDEYDDDFALDAIKKKNDRGHRTISAEAYGKYNQKGNFVPKVIAKTNEQKDRIKKRLENAFMFSALDDKEKNIVIDAMLEKQFSPGEYVIKQGDYGDHLYVVDSGQLDCLKKFKPDQPDTYLKTYQPGESFGELALLYNCPRAATIKAKTNAVIWELDRETFNNIVKDSAIKKRERYEEFLSKVEILKGMDPYERSKIADVLKTVKFAPKEYIIKQGENGDTFYFIEEGQAVATKKENPNDAEKEVYNYNSGDFFGELALRNNAPRQASVIAKTTITLAVIDRESFKRVLGPVENLLEKQTQKYVGYN